MGRPVKFFSEKINTKKLTKFFFYLEREILVENMGNRDCKGILQIISSNLFRISGHNFACQTIAAEEGPWDGMK